MAANIKSKEIQVQKPAQSLQAFQKNLSSGQELHTGMLRQVAVVVVVLVVAVGAFFGFRAWRARGIERHEAAVSELVLGVKGDGLKPVTPQDMEKRMREALPRLEALAKSAPSSRKAQVEALLAGWRLALDGKGGVPAGGDGPWDRLRSAQRFLALGQAKEAGQLLEALRKDAGPDEAWAPLFWSSQLELDSLQGNREQAWKDVAEYKARFKEKGDAATLERILQGI